MSKFIQMVKKCLILFCLFFATTSYGSNQKNKNLFISNCLNQGDSVTCLLNIAQQRLSTIKNVDKKAEALSLIVWTYADTKKENSELFKFAWDFFTQNKNKISAANQLDLYTSFIAYLSSVDKKSVNKAIPDLIEIYKKIKSSKNYEEQYAAIAWACDLFNSDDEVWKITQSIFVSECTNQNINQLQAPSLSESLQKAILKYQRDVAWSNKVSAAEGFSALWNFNNEMLKLATAKDGKSIRNDAFSFSALLKIMEADSIVRFENFSAATNQIDEAKIYIGKIDTTTYSGFDTSLLAKIQYINYFSSWGRINSALKLIAESEGVVDANLAKRTISSPEEIAYITKYAQLKYIDKNFNLADRLKIEKNQTLRQADVLFTAYKMISPTKQISKDVNPQLTLLVSAAEAGHPLAMYELGLINSAGLRGVPVNKQAAFYWYSQSALEGFAGAQNNLGDLYERGEGITQSYPEAIYWYTQAAMQGEPTAYLSLGEVFFKGLGVNKNFHRAVFWLSLAAQNLPDGLNKKNAQSLLSSALSELSKKDINIIYWQVNMFKPLKQTEYYLGDSPYKVD